MLTIDDLKQLGIEVDEEKAKALDEAVTARHEEEVKGLRSKRDELLETQRKLKDQLGQYDGIDVDRARRLEQILAEDEEARLIADGKVDEVVNRRTESMKTDYQRRLDEAQQQAEALKQRALSDEIRSAATQAGLLSSATDDAVLRAKQLFDVDAQGQVVPKDDAPLDKSGEPLTPTAWLESMKESAAHWFPSPRGSGAPGSTSSASVPRAWGEARTSAEKVEFLRQQQQ